MWWHLACDVLLIVVIVVVVVIVSSSCSHRCNLSDIRTCKSYMYILRACYSVSNQSVYNQWYYAGVVTASTGVLMASMSNDGLVTVDSGGCVRLWETAVFNLTSSLSRWRTMIGDASSLHNLQVRVSSVWSYSIAVCSTVCLISWIFPDFPVIQICFFCWEFEISKKKFIKGSCVCVMSHCYFSFVSGLTR